MLSYYSMGCFHRMVPYYYMNVPGPRPGARSEAFPALLQRGGKAACLAADEFFTAQISNPPTRRAYARPGASSNRPVFPPEPIREPAHQAVCRT